MSLTSISSLLFPMILGCAPSPSSACTYLSSPGYNSILLQGRLLIRDTVLRSQLCSKSFMLMKEPNSKSRREVRQQFLQCLWDGPPVPLTLTLKKMEAGKSWLGLFSTCNHPPSTPHPALCPEADLKVTSQLFLCSLASGHGGVCQVRSTVMKKARKS